MKKREYDFKKVYSLNELILALEYFSDFNYKLITVVNFLSGLYLIYEKEIED